jgi:hypothetical protein
LYTKIKASKWPAPASRWIATSQWKLRIPRPPGRAHSAFADGGEQQIQSEIVA